MGRIKHTGSSRLARILRRVGPLPSTKTFLQQAKRLPDFDLVDYLHGYIYARWPYWYISVGAGQHRSARLMSRLLSFVLNFLNHFPQDHPVVAAGAGLRPGRPAQFPGKGRTTFADTYHGKVLRLEAAKKLVSTNRSIQLGDLERVLPYSQARDLILENPDHIVVADCPCRACRSNPCRPLEVCLIIGEPFASLAVEHHPARTRRITSREAVDILQSEAERGHVHHAFFKHVLLNRFFAICSCCACCCGAMQLHRNEIPMLASSGYLAHVNATSCVGCGTCVEVCQFHALTLANGVVQVNPSICVGCGVCSSFCPQDALELVRDSNASFPLEVDELLAQRS